MKVIKIGGGCLKGLSVISHITDLIEARGAGQVFVLSALSGITDTLLAGIDTALENEDLIPAVVDRIRKAHLELASELVTDVDILEFLHQELESHFIKIERYFFGINFTREVTPRMHDIIVSYGERLSVILMAAVLKSRGCPARFIMPREAGMVTDGRFSDATALMAETTAGMRRNVLPLLDDETLLFMPGFFGISGSGEVTTFGRGGSDYSAAVVAAALGAELLEIWKDTEGFMTADPTLIPEARLIESLSYEEASELAYSGAAILHPRTVEPVRSSGIDIAIKNTLNPDAPGSRITEEAVCAINVIKSVSHTTDIAILKVFASGVGLRQGILAHIAGALSQDKINIKSVVTSQTCISLLLSQRDIDRAHTVIRDMTPRLYRESEQITDNALISVVGDGLHNHRGIAARCFTAVAEVDVNIEMISFGPSRAALYFLVHVDDLEVTMKALHSQFV